MTVPWVEPGAHEVATTVVDGPTPLTVRTPVDVERPPVVVFCHGLGGDHVHYAELSTWWASHGLVVVHPQFADSAAVVAAEHPELGLDPADHDGRWMTNPEAVRVLTGKLLEADHWRQRVEVVRRIVDEWSPQRVGVGGHSYGAYTAQLLCGVRIAGAEDLTDRRLRAGLLLSPQGSGSGRGLTPDSWRTLSCPIHVVTATNDQGLRGEGLDWKREPYDRATGVERYLTIIEAGDHGLGGIARPGVRRRDRIDDPAARAALAAVTTAFWHVGLFDDDEARRWLRSKPFAPLLTHEIGAVAGP